MKATLTLLGLAVVIELIALSAQPQIRPVRLDFDGTRTVMHINLAVTGDNPYAPFNYAN